MRKAIVLLVSVMLLAFSIGVFAANGGWEDDRVVYSYGDSSGNVVWTKVYNKVGSQTFAACVGPAYSEFSCSNDAKQYQEVSIRLKIDKTEHVHALKTDSGNLIYRR